MSEENINIDNPREAKVQGQEDFENSENHEEQEVAEDNDEQEEQQGAVEYEAKIEELNDKLIRSAAEIENMRRRFAQQQEESRKYAVSSFVKEIINVFENFFRIVDNAPQSELESSTELKNFFEGVKLTHVDLVKTLESNNIERIYPLNQPFDHNTQQAVSQIEADAESGTVVQVIQAGYKLNGRVLKEAMVVIAK